MKAITFEHLKRELDDEGAAKAVYNQIADAGGFGDIGAEFKDGLPALDVSGLSEAKQKRIEQIISDAKAKEVPKEAEKTTAKKEGK